MTDASIVLDHVHVTYSYRHHCMVSLVVGDAPGPDQWHLPTLDPRNEAKYHYPLHSLDVYFWTQHDALAFVDGVRRVLPPGQVDVQDEPAPPPAQQQQQQQQQPAQQVSAVVQQLENAAISESNTHHHLPGPPPGAPSFAPPPVADNRDPSPSTTTTSPAASFAPMAYNPAAPAAPEHIRPREKTPPPEDDDNDNSNGLLLGNHPLHARLAQDAATPFSPGLLSGMPSTPANMKSPLSPGVPPPQFHAPPGAPSFPGPPLGSPGLPPPQHQHMTHGGGGYGGYGGGAPTPMTPSHPGLQRAATVPVTQHTAAVAALASPTYGGSFSQQQQQPGTPTPAYTPTVPTYHPQQVQLQQQQQQPRTTPPVASSPGALPPPPPGGYSNYSYTTTQQQQQHNEYAIHQVAYRPTENEQAVQYVPKKEVRGRLEDRAGKLEKGVTGMLKRFEKKFG